MKKIYLVDETLNEFAKRGRPKKKRVSDIEGEERDDWYNVDDEFDEPEIGPEQIEDVELEDEVTDLSIQKRLKKMVDNELQIPEYSRGSIEFRVRSTGQKIIGVPMAKLSAGEAALFKDKKSGDLKKVRFDDMIVENYTGQQIFVSESFKDYE